MKHKFNLHEKVNLLNCPGYFGKIIFIDLLGGPNSTPRYLLDCFPGALAGYIWCVHPDGYGDDKTFAANWFNEDELTKE